MAGKLTHKQTRFAAEYLIDLNATQAAIRAGYCAKNADQVGPRLVGKSRVSEEIRTLMARRAKRVGVTTEQVLQELAKVAFSDITRIRVGENAAVTASEADAAAISSVKHRTKKTGEGSESVVEVRLWDKVRALQLLGQHLGLFSGNSGGQGDILNLPQAAAAFAAFAHNPEARQHARDFLATIGPQIGGMNGVGAINPPAPQQTDSEDGRRGFNSR